MVWKIRWSLYIFKKKFVLSWAKKVTIYSNLFLLWTRNRPQSIMDYIIGWSWVINRKRGYDFLFFLCICLLTKTFLLLFMFSFHLINVFETYWKKKKCGEGICRLRRLGPRVAPISPCEGQFHPILTFSFHWMKLP